MNSVKDKMFRPDVWANKFTESKYFHVDYFI